LEDVLAAGALCDLLIGQFSDSAQVARTAYAYAESDLGAAVCNSENARRLLTSPELRGDVS
jgi:phosphosulfolactate phosphohydrolase-like enzyme